MYTNLKQKGFTIVELLIVIVVIGILAAITIVAYNGIQGRANDSRIKTAANQMEKAIITFNINTGKQPHSGSQSTGAVDTTNKSCPSTTVASGWAAKPIYYCTIEDLLLLENLIPTSLFPSLPPNKAYGNSYHYTFMFYQCSAETNNRYALFWYLANPSTEETNNLNSTLSACGLGTNLRDDYGMRAAKIIQL